MLTIKPDGSVEETKPFIRAKKDLKDEVDYIDAQLADIANRKITLQDRKNELKAIIIQLP